MSEVIRKILFPHYNKKISTLEKDNTYLSYYCDADTAVKVFKTQTIWMRNIRCMNDYKEVQHGWHCFKKIWNKDNDFYNTLQRAQPEFVTKINEKLEHIEQFTNLHTYLTCFSEHSLDEDKRGKLSMWRAYGKENGIALVIKNTPFIEINESYNNLYTSPVAYFDEAKTENYINTIGKELIKFEDELKNTAFKELDSIFTEFLLFSIICNKHPGFKEEKEWRAIYMPYNKDLENPNILRKNTTINNVPQMIFELPLYKKLPSHGEGYSLNDIIEAVIIGPTNYPFVIFDSIADAMTKAGIENANQKIKFSDIPYRNN